jgi:para-aminobenzoate synthetase/4-amino-4-deoxychorismate lyase
LPPALSPAERFDPAARETGAILLETQRPSSLERASLLFRAPVRLLAARCLPEVVPLLEEAGDLRSRGFAVAGYVAYEAGFALDDAFRKDAGRRGRETGEGFPLAWLGVYDRWLSYDHRSKRWTACGTGVADWPGPLRAPTVPWPGDLPEPVFSLPEAGHAAGVAVVRDAIARGEVYQANLTGAFRFPFPGDPFSLYLRLRAAQPVPFGAFLRTDEGCIVSQSPELFFRVRGSRIETRPMKGTVAPGATDAEDRAAASALRRDPKNRAENVMIVDLIRNDLGRICETGSIRATRLFEVERHRTVLQMVSAVEGSLRDGETPRSLFRALFPCGSVTGAPKISAMRLLESIEPAPRGVYTGAIGAFLPGGEAAFSVAIRTVTLRGGTAVAGAGGGIVWDSDAAEEYREVLQKGRYLVARPPDFRLIETLAWRPEEGFPRLSAHLDRLAASARHFGFPADRRRIRASLGRAVAADGGTGPLRVRILVSPDGRTDVELAPLPPPADRPWRVRLSRRATDSRDPFLRHKTTRRALYDAERAAALADGFDEVLFLNRRGELTEGSITNVFLDVGGALFTPPAACGLLEGVGRRFTLADPESRAAERILTEEDLRLADRILLCNAVRGLIPARLAG